MSETSLTKTNPGRSVTITLSQRATSKKFDALVNVASELGGMAITAAVGLAVGSVAVAVPFALIALSYRLDKSLGSDSEKDVDN